MLILDFYMPITNIICHLFKIKVYKASAITQIIRYLLNCLSHIEEKNENGQKV